MNRMSEVDIAWLAGMIEGEASIGAWKATRNAVKYARVEISSVDSEVIDRLFILTGIGRVHKQYGPKDRPSHKPSNTWRVAKAEEVLDLLETVSSYGYFSEHRKKQILDAVEAASSTVQRKKSGESFSRKR